MLEVARYVYIEDWLSKFQTYIYNYMFEHIFLVISCLKFL